MESETNKPESTGAEPTLLWPPHAYIPGLNQRHPEGWFDDIRNSVKGVSVDQLPKSAAWCHAMAYIEHEFYWEAHEVMEAVWFACAENSAEKLYVQSVIQSANAALKRKMGRESAARRLEEDATRLHKEALLRKPQGMFGDINFDDTGFK